MRTRWLKADGADDPGDQRPDRLWVSSPEEIPRPLRPNTSYEDDDRQRQTAKADTLIAEIIQLSQLLLNLLLFRRLIGCRYAARHSLYIPLYTKGAD